MMVKQDSCRLNNTDSFLYTVFRNVDIVECIVFIGKGILPKSSLIYVIIIILLLQIFIEFIYKFLLMFCYTHVLKRHFLNDGKRKTSTMHLFSVTNEKCE